jgi:Ca2+-transporting ATPase
VAPRRAASAPPGPPGDADGSPPAWHALGRPEVETRLDTGPRGLAPGEVEVRLARHGENRLADAPGRHPLVLLAHQFSSPLIAILLLAAAVTLALREWMDALVIAAVLVLNATIGFVQEHRAERAVQALMGLLAPRARVIRGGREWDVESRHLVPGDLVLLESGSRVPADLRLVAATALLVDESLLTGESTPALKDPAALDPGPRAVADRTNMAYAGTVVASGRARGYVVATGGATELGTIAAGVRRSARPETPLQRRLGRFARVVGIVVVAGAAAAFALGVARGEPPARMFTVAVALAVSAVPEGLPIAFTITLAIGVRRMARRNAIIRRLPAVETLGSITAIGSDKTGTLTENRMVVQRLWAAGRSFVLAGDDPRGPGTLQVGGEPALLDEHPALHLTLLAGVLANEADVALGDAGWQTRGDPTEAALLIGAVRLGLEPAQLRDAYPAVAELPFEPARQYSASVRRHGDEHLLFVKGAPERVLAMCTAALGDRAPEPLDAAAVLRAAHDLAARGLRVLAMAYRRLPAPPPPAELAADPRDLVFLGLQGSLDPPRAGVHDAVRGCQASGIRVVMITGDHAATARAIAAELGIAPADAPVLDGADLARMDDAALADAVRSAAVYARVAPDDKLRIVRALQGHGEVVAVTGDGVNDAPALKAAQVGIAMGRGGTDVAREAADVVLADDNFVSIHAAVEEGRVTFDNLRKATLFLISTGAAEILTILTALWLGWPLPFVPAQILWLNLVTEGLQDLAFAFEPGEPGTMERPPRSPREGIVSRLLWERTVLSGVVMAAGTLAAFRWELDATGDLTAAQSVALTTMVLFQAFHLGNCRSERRSAFAVSPFSNRLLLLAAVAALLVHAAALHLPVTQLVLRVVPVGADRWAQMAVLAVTIVVAVEGHKRARRGG